MSNLIFLTLLSTINPAMAGTVEPGPQTSTFSGSVRGYWFVTPTAIRITGLMVPTTASTSAQSIELLRLASAPPTFSSTTSNYTVEARILNDTSTTYVPVDVFFDAGEYVGLLGYRGGVNSYATQPQSVQIDGQSVTLRRMGYQGGLPSANVWSEPTSSSTYLGRVFFEYTSADADNDGEYYTTDCDDSDPLINSSAQETCNGLDDNCDGLTDDASAIDAVEYFADMDADNYGDASVSTYACSQPSNYVPDNTDCDDNNLQINPGMAEYCNGADDNCDGLTDDSSAVDQGTWYVDSDGDTYGSQTPMTACSQPSGTVGNDDDCDDNRNLVYPGADELCNLMDDNCDGTTDESSALDVLTWYQDADSDSYGNATVQQTSCYQPSGYVSDMSDCDDTAGSVYPGATEQCNNVDDNCDGQTDDASSVDVVTWYVDGDSDGYGGSTTVESCVQPSGTTASMTDCDDGNNQINPGMSEACNGVDDNCDGSIDDASSVDAATWYADSDSDGFGDALASMVACAQPLGYLADNTDCDDSNNQINPGMSEACNGVDDNCDGALDDASSVDAATWYADLDSDGYGDPLTTMVACSQPLGYLADSTDCDDTSIQINPDQDEVCNGLDDNCDGLTDDSSAINQTTWYTDADQDGYGDVAVVACDQPDGTATVGGDCDDTNTAYNPGAAESCSDPNDYNCDGSVGYADADLDGFAACEDCDDTATGVNPNAIETCNGIDDNCDGLTDDNSATGQSVWYADLDGDTYGDPASYVSTCEVPTGYVADNTDCDDANLAAFPGNTETCDGADNNCDGSIDENATDATTYYADSDQDGFGDANTTTTACGEIAGFVSDATDCDDASNTVYPGQTEVCENGVDDNCNLEVDEDCASDSEPTDSPTDSDVIDSEPADSEPTDSEGKEPGCGCAAVEPGGAMALALLGASLLRRRRQD